MAGGQDGQGEGPATPEPSGGAPAGAPTPGERAIAEGIAAARPVPLRVVSPDSPPFEEPPPDDGAGDGPRRGRSDDDGPGDLALSRHSRSDLGNAKRLIARFGEDLMYVDNIGWHAWDGRRWLGEAGEFEAQKHAQRTGELILDEARAMKEAGPWPTESEKDFNDRVAAHRKFSISCGNSGKIEGMLKQAQPHLLVLPTALDTHDWMINLANVMLDLDQPRWNAPDEQSAADDEALRQAAPHTPEIREGRHSREHRSTRIAEVDYDPLADCPRWRAWLAQILPDDEVRLFVQRWFGYCLTGDISEQSLMCCYGTGSNGKSTLTEIMGEILGSYAVTVPIETFLTDDRKSGGSATPDIARLPGARLVLAAEPEVGAKMSESVVKKITGGEKVSARKLFQDQFEFRPRFKLVISFNIKPTIRGQDEGIWRRILLVPFKVHIPKNRRDKHLKEKLLTEKPGIFNWMLDGYRLWREYGLNPPDSVVAATEAYRSESDPIGQYMDQMVRRQPGAVLTASSLYEHYETWAKENGNEPVSKTLFGRRLGDKGYEKDKVGGFMVYLDVEWKPDGGLAGGLESSAPSSPDPGV